MDFYVIAVGNKQVWVANPSTKQQVRIKPAKDITRVLDIHSNSSGVYHASERIIKESKKDDKGITRQYEVNFVQVFDTLTGNSILTIRPPNSEGLPLEDRCVPISFSFVKKNGSLPYTLNDSKGVVFEKSNGEREQSGKTTYDGNKVYFDGKKIATLDEKVNYVTEVDASQFSKAFKRKNRERYDKNRALFH